MYNLMKMQKRHTRRRISRLLLADDATESLSLLIRLRVPWLFAGLIGGFLASMLMGKHEAALNQDVRLAFFIPFIVYLSDAVGTQTETIYVRNSGKKRDPHFHQYLLKETLLGCSFGVLFGILTTLFTYVWLRDALLSVTVGTAMGVSIAVAPLVALLIARTFQLRHHDPAAGAGPFTTILQDVASILIYFAIASAVLFS